MPYFRLGLAARRIQLCYANALRDVALQKPIRYRLIFGAQRALALAEEKIRGRDSLYRAYARLRASDCCIKHVPSCGNCALRAICDGFTNDYVQYFGGDEAVPVVDIPPVHDPTFFIRQQQKIVESEDAAWAL